MTRKVDDTRAAELARLCEDRGLVVAEVVRDLLADRAADRAECEWLQEALVALTTAGIATPVEGYAEAPHMLAADIRRLARERDEALRLLREAADEIIDLAESLHEAIEQEQEIAGSAYVDPLVDLHGRLTAALERPDAAPPAPEPDQQGWSAARVLAEVGACAAGWVPEARILGDVQAGDIVRAVREVLHLLEEARDSLQEIEEPIGIRAWELMVELQRVLK